MSFGNYTGSHKIKVGRKMDLTLLKEEMTTGEMTDALVQKGLLDLNVDELEDVFDFERQFAAVDQYAGTLGYHYDEQNNIYVRNDEE